MSKTRTIPSGYGSFVASSQPSFSFPTIPSHNAIIPAVELAPGAVATGMFYATIYVDCIFMKPFSLASPCIHREPRTNIPHPSDPTKYIACLTRTKFEVMECPAGLFYDGASDACQGPARPTTLCERENPCLNGGQCYEVSGTTKCTCRGAWTGERCETPVSSCATNPCGDGNQCHTLIASDYKQDYVCFCEGSQTYGLSCDKSMSSSIDG